MTNKLLKPDDIVPDDPLSFLVDYKLNIDALSTVSLKETLMSELNASLKLIKQPGFFTYYLNNELKEKATSQVDKIDKAISEFEDILDEFKLTTAQFLREEEKSYLSKSYRMYETAKQQDSSGYILDRTLFHTLIYRDYISDDFINLIHSHSSWKHPGIFIRPEHGKYASEMTSSDPLYIVDEILELLAPVQKLWNAEYTDRVRYSFVDESREVIFKNIPCKQLGLVVAMNFFNHKPIEVIKRYLLEIIELLKPGGVLIFTFNNCNYPLAVKNFEKSLYSYTPETLLTPMCEFIGFEVISTYNNTETNVSWLELKKPGDLTTLRGGQCLGKINV
jgi:hypothetical protein